MCNDKEKGGLDIRDLNMFNVALFGKWIWRFLNEPNRLWVEFVKSKYGGFGLGLGGESGRSSRSGFPSFWSGWWVDIYKIY